MVFLTAVRSATSQPGEAACPLARHIGTATQVQRVGLRCRQGRQTIGRCGSQQRAAQGVQELDPTMGNQATVPATARSFTPHTVQSKLMFRFLARRNQPVGSTIRRDIANTSVQQLQGSRRSGSWMIRIPVDRYRDFLRSASGLGVPQSNAKKPATSRNFSSTWKPGSPAASNSSRKSCSY